MNVTTEMKYDMGWQKRGSGRCYNSKSGVGTVIGNRTGKICGYGVRSKDCRTCVINQNKGLDPPDHQCSKNWEGSSRSMEPDVAVEIVKKIENSAPVGVIIMDDDCATMAKLRSVLDHPVEKWSDLNHTSKHLTNALYLLQKKHKPLTTRVIKYFQKCFSYAIAQNQGKPLECKSALHQIVPHAFGNHENCPERWCGYKIDPEQYKHKGLPYGRDLSGDELKADVAAVFEIFEKNVEKIAPAASTRDVESFNNMVSSKAPKRIHYSSSKSLETRVSCAVAQKNEGNTYVSDVYEALGISPGKFYREHAARKDRVTKRRLEYEGTREFKLRKLERKQIKSGENSAAEIKEGTTYKSGIGLTSSLDTVNIPSAEVVQITKVTEDVKRVFCDIETGSLSKTADILQIAAVHGEERFSQYFTPTQPVAAGATEVTGISAQGPVLLVNNTPVSTVSPAHGLQLFVDFLENVGRCVLVGHNFERFDMPRIIRHLENANLLPAFGSVCAGIVDTLPLLKAILPDQSSYKQESLVTAVLNETYNAHDALGDVVSLQRLCEHINISEADMKQHSSSLNTQIAKFEHSRKAEKCANSLQELVDKKVISRAMSTRIASSGLSLDHLKLAVSRGELDGLAELFKEKVEGKPRVTARMSIIQRVFDFMKKS